MFGPIPFLVEVSVEICLVYIDFSSDSFWYFTQGEHALVEVSEQRLNSLFWILAASTQKNWLNCDCAIIIQDSCRYG